ncbi:GD21202 [Drosophila simulans]|uniref:GD21202 n=1 Tax=Drosophila simulans TaxID=7240 RepID=B4QUS9_DROSI|nr:GD21202 [Drosophila simulans]
MSVSDLIGALDAIPKLTVPESLVPEETSVFLDAPEWLTESYLQDALRKYYNDQHIRIIGSR